MSRRPISKSVRFSIFKRDGFICQYCGVTPPNAILHVDHIVPVKEGGQNDPDNLITSCDQCNIGKGAKPLSAVPESLREKAKKVAEAEDQIRGYAEIMAAKKARIEDDVWNVVRVLNPRLVEDGIKKDWFASIKRFIEELGYPSVEEAMEIAASKIRGDRKAFLYFFGICWNRIRGPKNG